MHIQRLPGAPGLGRRLHRHDRAQVQQLVGPAPHPVHRAHAVLSPARERDPSPGADGEHDLRDQDPRRCRRPRSAALRSRRRGRGQGRDRAHPAPLPEPQGRDDRPRPHRAPDVVGAERSGLGAQLGGAQEPGLHGPHLRPRRRRGAGHRAVLIGNTVVFKDVPDWISRRREGEPPDHADRARFGKKLFAAILEHVDSPRPVPSATPSSSSRQIEPPPPPEINRTLIEGMVLRIAASATRVTGYEVAEALALPFAAIEPILKNLTGQNLLDALGLAQEQGPWLGRPLPERRAYPITKQGRARSDQIADASTRYLGPAPVSMAEYKAVLAE